MPRFLTSLVLALTLCPPTTSAEEIHLAARKGDAEALRQLIAAGVPVDQPSTKNTSQPGVTALYVASQFARVDAAKVLLEAGADPAIRPLGDLADGTPMHMAARRGSIEIVNMYLDQGVDPNLYDLWLGTPLHVATQRGNDEMVNLLLERGAEPTWAAPSIADDLANADLAAGEVISRGCTGLCHSLDPKANMSLWNIVNAPKAARNGYQYSEALTSLGGTWSLDELNSYIAAPGRFLPGTGMIYSVPDDRKRADLLAFLMSLTNS